MSNWIVAPRRLAAGAFALAAGLVALGAPASATAEEIAVKMAFHWGPKHHSAKHAQIFADEVNKRAAGRLKIEVYPSGQLFGIREILGAVTSGAVQIGGIVPIVSFPPINKNYNVAAHPGLFNSYQQQRDFFMKDATGQAIWKDMTTKSDTTLIMYNPVGPVMTFSSEGPLDSVAAMKGLKARALLKLERPRWDALEVNSVSLPTREVYTSLQSGLINTLNTPPGSVEAYSWWEFLNYAQLPYQYFSDAYMMANTTWWNTVPADLQQIMLEVGEEIGAQSTATILATGDSTLAKFKERGGVVTELSGEARAQFDSLMNEKVVPAMADLVDAEVLAAAQAFAAQN